MSRPCVPSRPLPRYFRRTPKPLACCDTTRCWLRLARRQVGVHIRIHQEYLVQACQLQDTQRGFADGKLTERQLAIARQAKAFYQHGDTRTVDVIDAGQVDE